MKQASKQAVSLIKNLTNADNDNVSWVRPATKEGGVKAVGRPPPSRGG